jgi:hypothetical protein
MRGERMVVRKRPRESVRKKQTETESGRKK